MSEQPKDGGPAFPARPQERMMGGIISAANEGMSLRDWFAGQALAGMLAGEPGAHLATPRIGIEAYAVADAMLAARNSTSTKET